MQKTTLVLALLLASSLGTVLSAPTGIKQKAKGPVYVIEVHGMVDDVMYESIKRGVRDAKAAGCDLIVFEIDTWGGLLHAAFDIADYISEISFAKTVAYIPRKAISAGSLIAMACDAIVMGENATLGDCAPIIPTAEGMKILGEKVQSPLRAYFKKFAEKNGYPVALAEAMVTKELEVYEIETAQGRQFITSEELDVMTQAEKIAIRSKKLVVPAGRLLTMHTREALDYGFCSAKAGTVSEAVALFAEPGAPMIVRRMSWSEHVVRFISTISPILLIVGFAAMWAEMKAPGFGLPGIVSIICFALVFFSKYMIGLADAPEILIFGIGVVLLLVEIFVIPGFGIVGISGIGLILLGLLLAFQDFIIPRTPFEVGMLWGNVAKIGLSIIAAVALFVFVAKRLPESKFVSPLFLAATEDKNEGYTSESSETFKLLGSRGVATSALRPAGIAEIDGERIDVVAEGEFIEAGEPVVVIETRGNRIVVRRAT